MLSECLSPHLHRASEAASEHGASCWLTTLPIAEQGFALPKAEFRDALLFNICLKLVYICGKTFSGVCFLFSM